MKAPWFTGIAVLMLALGIAMSTATFSIASNALLRPLPFPQPEQLVRVFTASVESPSEPLAPGNAMDLHDEFGDVGEFDLFIMQEQNVAEPGQAPEQELGMSVSADVLRMLGVEPVLGRNFTPDEDKPGKPGVVLLTNRFWHEKFTGDPAVLGKVLRIGTGNFTVIGILPPKFDEPQLWYGCRFVTNQVIWPAWRTERASKWISVMGRLKPGVTLAQAQARLDVLSARLQRDHARDFGPSALHVVPLGTSFAPTHTGYWLVVGLATLVLVIACANLGGVQLARVVGRRSELAVRTALGATRRHLITALAAECILIALAGTLAGALLTYWNGALIGRWLGGPALDTDWRVIAFAMFGGTLAILCFGLVPAWLMTRRTMADTLKDASRGSTGRAHQHLKSTLIIGQLALALVLVSTAASLIFGIRQFLDRDRGWRPDGLVTGAFNITWDWVQKEAKSPTLAQRVESKLGSIPGVQAVGLAATLPVYGYLDQNPITIEGATPVAAGLEPRPYVTGVNAGYFDVIGIRLLQGRLLPAEWRPTDPPAVVISAATARHLWPNKSPLGGRLRIAEDKTWREVIGIVSDVNMNVGFNPAPTDLQVYRPIQELTGPWFSFILKSAVPASALEKSIRTDLKEIDPDFMVVQIGDLPQLLEQFVTNRPLNIILTSFAAAGLMIAMMGLYGAMSQLVQQRRREIGVRLALGAPGQRIITMILAQAGRLLVVGSVVGVGGTYAIGIMLRSIMPMLPPLGLLMQFAIGSSLALAGLAACYIPSRRAARIDPIEVLRAE